MPPNRDDLDRRTVRVVFALKKRGGRKTILPDRLNADPAPTSTSAFTKALAKAYRWRRQIEDGEYSSIRELSRAKEINESYACRVLRLSLLSPNIIERAIADALPAELIRKYWKHQPANWHEQPLVDVPAKGVRTPF